MRIAFIGLGGATRGLHLPAARSVDDLEVVGGADPSAEARSAWVALGAGPAFADVDEMLEKARPDIAVVATPPHLHADGCLRALRAGTHVICEKPFVESVEQASEVVDTAAQVGRQVAVNTQYRYMPIFGSVAPAIGSTGIGRPVLIQATQLMDLAPWDEPVPWRAAMPNRTLFEGGVHIVDLVHFYMRGRSPVRVSATLSPGLDPARNADAVHLVTLDYGDGAFAQITINRLARTGTRYLDIRVDCEEASIRASYGGRAYLQVGIKRAERAGVRVDLGLEGLAWIERGSTRKVLARNPRGVSARATSALYAATVSALRRGDDVPTPARTSLETLRIIEAAYRSAQRHEVVALDDTVQTTAPGPGEEPGSAR